jgi:mRNA interferase MazF
LPYYFKEKRYPFEVDINIKNISGVILADQIKSLDYKRRNAIFIAKAPNDVIEILTDYICALIGY